MAGGVGLGTDQAAAAEPPPETTTIRLVRFPFDVTCVAPQWVAEELLRAEGFSTVEYVTRLRTPQLPLAAGEVDMALLDAPGLLLLLDAGKPIVTLMGVHGGCYELFATDPVRSVRDLHGAHGRGGDHPVIRRSWPRW